MMNMNYLIISFNLNFIINKFISFTIMYYFITIHIFFVSYSYILQLYQSLYMF